MVTSLGIRITPLISHHVVVEFMDMGVRAVSEPIVLDKDPFISVSNVGMAVATKIREGEVATIQFGDVNMFISDYGLENKLNSICRKLEKFLVNYLIESDTEDTVNIEMFEEDSAKVCIDPTAKELIFRITKIKGKGDTHNG